MDGPISSHATFSGAEGVEIFWQQWLPAVPQPAATVVIAHGVSEHSGRYAHVAARLNAAGYSVAALDHRGHGRSGGDRCVVDRMDNAVADLGTAIALARDAVGAPKLFLLGHSMGGAIALEYALHDQGKLDGLILSAPAAALEAASRFELVAGRVLSRVAPSLGVFAIDSSSVSRDPQVVIDYDADPLGFHGKLPARTVAELAGVIETFPERVGSLRLPLLVMLGTGDKLVPPDAGRMVHAGASSAEKKLIEYDGLYHEILNEPEQDRVMDDLVAWLDAH